MSGTLETLDAIADRLDQLALAATDFNAGKFDPDELERLAGQVRDVATEVAAGAVRPAPDTWDLNPAPPVPDAVPSVKFKRNGHFPHAAVYVYVGSVDRTHALVGTLRCRESDLVALRGIDGGPTVVSWERVS